jgi:hypothetical protein
MILWEKRKLIVILLSIVGLMGVSFSYADDQKKEIPTATVFSIPSSPAFSLLDINPTRVNRPGFLRDFKLDWVLENGQLSPNIAIDIQPIWLVFFKNVNRDQYIKKHWYEKTLSTITFSLGTHQKSDIRALAYAFKINLVRYDLLEDRKFAEELKPLFEDPPGVKAINENLSILRLNMRSKQKELGQAKTDDEKKNIQKAIEKIDLDKIRLEKDIADYDNKNKKEIDDLIKKYENDHWNDPALDLGYGRLSHYTGADLGTLKFDYMGMGMWINGGIGIGKKILIAGLLRYIDNLNQGVHEKRVLGGANVRYGNPKYDFFIEGVFERIQGKNKYTVAYGGNYKISSNIILQFGIRTEYNKDFKFSNLIPLINMSWIQNDQE